MVEVSIRADRLSVAGTKVKIELSIILNEVGTFTKELELTVVEAAETYLIPTPYTAAMKAIDW